MCYVERNPPAPGWTGDRLRWRKEQMAYRPATEQPDRHSHSQAESDAHVEGNLATEVSLVILDTLEQIVQVSRVLTISIAMRRMDIYTVTPLATKTKSSWENC